MAFEHFEFLSRVFHSYHLKNRAYIISIGHEISNVLLNIHS